MFPAVCSQCLCDVVWAPIAFVWASICASRFRVRNFKCACSLFGMLALFVCLFACYFVVLLVRLFVSLCLRLSVWFRAVFFRMMRPFHLSAFSGGRLFVCRLGRCLVCWLVGFGLLVCPRCSLFVRLLVRSVVGFCRLIRLVSCSFVLLVRCCRLLRVVVDVWACLRRAVLGFLFSWQFGFVAWSIGSALRVHPAVARLTVYRRL